LAKTTGDDQKVIDYYARYIKLAQEMNLPLLESIVQEYEQLRSKKKYNPFITGSPVFGEIPFGGRKKELGLLLNHIQQHNHVMLVAQRRMGKTSLLLQLKKRLQSPLVPVSIDLLAFLGQAEEMLRGILNEIVNELLRRNLLSSDQQEKFSITYAQDFVAALASILEDVKRKLKDIKIVLILDEAERLFVTDRLAAGVLRAALTQNENIVAVLAGSSRLLTSDENDPNSPLLNIFTPLLLPPLSKKETESLVRELSKQVGVSYEPSALERLYDLSGGIPYYVQIIGYRLIELARLETKDTVTAKDIDKIKVVQDLGLSHALMYALDNLDEQEKNILVAIANNDPQEEFDKDSIRKLEIKQLIVKESATYQFTARLFEEWFKKYNNASNENSSQTLL
jgi:AAA-like domain